jgi:hypothetical protein
MLTYNQRKLTHVQRELTYAEPQRELTHIWLHANEIILILSYAMQVA